MHVYSAKEKLVPILYERILKLNFFEGLIRLRKNCSLERKEEMKEKKQEELVKISLLELLRGLLEYATERGVRSFPPLHHPLWHNFLYKLKTNPGFGLADIISQIVGDFSWKGRKKRPISQCYLEMMRRLMRFCFQRSYDLRLILNPRAPRLKDGLFFPPVWFKEAVARGYELAKEIPRFFEVEMQKESL